MYPARSGNFPCSKKSSGSKTRWIILKSEYEILSRAHDLFRPNRLKLLLAVTLLVPVFFAIVLINGFPYSDLVLPSALTAVIRYAAACVIDDAVQSRTVKIAIASVAALVSIILYSVLVRSMTMVCDPVHDPGHIVCNPDQVPETTTAAPVVIATVQPTSTTPMIFDPVHEPGACRRDVCGIAPDHAPITRALVAQKLEECLQNCNR